MSEQEELALFDKITQGLKKGYEELLIRKAALGQDVVVSDGNGHPVVVPASEMLERYYKQQN